MIVNCGIMESFDGYIVIPDCKILYVDQNLTMILSKKLTINSNGFSLGKNLVLKCYDLNKFLLLLIKHVFLAGGFHDTSKGE